MFLPLRVAYKSTSLFICLPTTSRAHYCLFYQLACNDRCRKVPKRIIDHTEYVLVFACSTIFVVCFMLFCYGSGKFQLYIVRGLWWLIIIMQVMLYRNRIRALVRPNLSIREAESKRSNTADDHRWMTPATYAIIRPRSVIEFYVPNINFLFRRSPFSGLILANLTCNLTWYPGVTYCDPKKKTSTFAGTP